MSETQPLVLAAHVKIEVAEASYDDFMKLMNTHGKASRLEQGNLRFDICCDPEDKTKLTLYEAWKDLPAIVANNATQHMKDTQDAAGAGMAKIVSMQQLHIHNFAS